MTSKRVLIVGAGFSGAVLARELAELANIQSLVIDSRSHIAGNCHTERDADTGVMVHRYGPHIFHTSNLEVWKYINRFGVLRPFVNRVKAHAEGGVYGLPINLHTINQYFGRQMSPAEARAFLSSKADQSIGTPQNFEEQALKFIGPELYHAFFRGYTIKQWGCDPTELPASILKRLPVRFNYDDSYYSSIYQGMPEDGYTAIVANILEHENIEVKLNEPWSRQMADEFDWIFYTGPLDAYFGYSDGYLGYRTVNWTSVRGSGDFQGNAVINYTDQEITHTRIHEHKHFAPWENHDNTIAFIEYSKETGKADEPFYPKRLQSDMNRLESYRARAINEQRVTFLGRLATYRYLDMHVVIEEALGVARDWLSSRQAGSQSMTFPNSNI